MQETEDAPEPMRTFVIGDIHGRIEALKEVLQKCEFDYGKDKLICLGDVADGGYNTYECVEELLKIRNLIYIMGNHDEWFLNNIKSGWAEEIWIQQGGANTLRSYGAKVRESRRVDKVSYIDTRELRVPVTHQDFFNRAAYWHIEEEMLFVHGGIVPNLPLLKQDKFVLVWDRELIEYAKEQPVPGYKWVFVGHTTTQTQGRNPMITDVMEPIIYNNLVMMDTGAGWNGKLTIMDVYSRKFWQSKEQVGGR